MDMRPMLQAEFERLIAATKEPAVGSMQCCGFSVSGLKATVPLSMVIKCPHCGKLWEVLAQ